MNDLGLTPLDSKKRTPAERAYPPSRQISSEDERLPRAAEILPESTFSSQHPYAISAAVLLLSIVLLTFLPAGAKHFLHTRGHFHSAAHVVAFTVLAFAVGRTSKAQSTRILLLAGLIVFGFSTELAEHLVYKTALEWKDIAVDSLGVFLGFSLAMLKFEGANRPARFNSSETLV